MKVLFVSNDQAIFEANSPVRKRMREYGNSIGTLHIIGRAKRRVEETDGPLVLHGYRLGALGAFVSFPSSIRTLITKHDIEIVSAQDPFEYGWMALQGLVRTKAKLHIQIHTDFLSPWFTRGTFVTSLINRTRIRFADKVLPHAQGIRVVSKRISDSLKKRYASRIPEPTVLPIPPSLPLPPKLPLPPHSFTFALLAVCRLEEEKRVEDLFHALFRAQQHYPNTGLIIIGDGREREALKQKAQSCCRPDSVQFLGWHDDALSFMQSANAFVQASAYEGYGRTLVEAALARVPIVTSDVGVVGELFIPGVDVLAFPPGDVGALARAIEQVIEDERLRLMLPMQAQMKAKQHLASLADQPKRIRDDLAEVLKRA